MNTGSYETAELLHQYLLFHYGKPEDQLPWSFGPKEGLSFPERCVSEGVRLPASGRALDVGCAVGRSTFELGKIYSEVIGIDYSGSFIEAAKSIASEGTLSYLVRETGTIVKEAEARQPDGVTAQLKFLQGDAQCLPADLGTFDCLLAANLLCRLAQPLDFLDRLPELIRPGGQLVITTPNTWLESFTAREFWIGATPETGQPLEALKAHLKSAFQFEEAWDMPFLIREHRRKFQWSVAQASRWIRKI